MHLIGLGLKKKLGIKWVADFRDPWTNIDFYKELKLSKWADNKHYKLEQEVLNNADGIVAIGKGVIKNLLEIPSKTPVIIIPNGFDEDDFSETSPVSNKSFVIAHFGSINKTRNPEGLWKALQELKKKNQEVLKNIKVNLFGKVDHLVIESIDKRGLSNIVEVIDYLPHDKMLSELMNTNLLLLMINRVENAVRITTGKIFEYIGSGRPILGLGPLNGDAAKILENAEAGNMYDWDDIEGIKNYVLEEIGKPDSAIEKIDEKRLRYSRKALTKEMANFMDIV
jgi:glycosyltransferase involved in cell wall biosynthesis